jgi:hypothetical protein
VVARLQAANGAGRLLPGSRFILMELSTKLALLPALAAGVWAGRLIALEVLAMGPLPEAWFERYLPLRGKWLRLFYATPAVLLIAGTVFCGSIGAAVVLIEIVIGPLRWLAG